MLSCTLHAFHISLWSKYMACMYKRLSPNTSAIVYILQVPTVICSLWPFQDVYSLLALLRFMHRSLRKGSKSIWKRVTLFPVARYPPTGTARDNSGFVLPTFWPCTTLVQARRWQKTTTIGARVSANYQSGYAGHMTTTFGTGPWHRALIF
jgi:hypothetical protein